MNNRWIILILLVVSAFTHFAYFGHPNQTVFDEVHFGKFISGYYTHEYFFDIHPPLGKLIIAGFGTLFDFKPEFSFANIGEQFPDSTYRALRLLPTLAGMLLPLVLFGLAREVGFTRAGAATIGFLAAIENALIVQSRFILLDAFLLLFGFSAFWCYARWRKRGNVPWLIGTGIFAALALSIKWTGISFLGLILVCEALRWFHQRSHVFETFAALIVLPFAIYAATFAVHFSLLTESGPGDAFMSAEFQSTLTGSRYASPDVPTAKPGFFAKFAELNIEMYRSNQNLTATHSYGSPWFTWPFMVRPIFYWVSGVQRIYLLGNPLLWWLSTVGILALALRIVSRRQYAPVAFALVGGWVVNLLPFIGVQRVMFLYHYFIPLILAIAALVYVVERMPDARKYLIAIASISLLSFLFFAPLTYGLSLSETAYAQRVWFSTWR